MFKKILVGIIILLFLVSATYGNNGNPPVIEGKKGPVFTPCGTINPNTASDSDLNRCWKEFDNTKKGTLEDPNRLNQANLNQKDNGLTPEQKVKLTADSIRKIDQENRGDLD